MIAHRLGVAEFLNWDMKVFMVMLLATPRNAPRLGCDQQSLRTA
jgi:hypothetical protein